MPIWIEDRFYWENKNQVNAHRSVDENVRRNTGLLDSQGKRIFKEPNEIGFMARQNLYSVER